MWIFLATLLFVLLNAQQQFEINTDLIDLNKLKLDVNSMEIPESLKEQVELLQLETDTSD